MAKLTNKEAKILIKTWKPFCAVFMILNDMAEEYKNMKDNLATFEYKGNKASIAIYTKGNENLVQITVVRENGSSIMTELTVEELITLVMTKEVE
jgi:hypothetical protein